MASMSTLESQSISFQFATSFSKDQTASNLLKFRARIKFNYLNSYRRKTGRDFPMRVVCSSKNSSEGERIEDGVVRVDKDYVDSKIPFSRLRGTISTLTPVILVMKRHVQTNLTIGWCIVIAFMVVAVREFVARNQRSNYRGSVADLVKRGQLRSDRRGISRPLKYDDPFNNPMVKVDKSNSTVQMCGKVYRLAPVTLTEEQQSVHQKRRSRAYQWKRPTIFLKEGDSVPPNVDPDTIRWIPANHPFATTVSEIDEDLAQNNVYQKHGVPFRIKAEHEALQKKLEALQNGQELNKLVIDPANAKDFERSFKSLSNVREQAEHCSSDNQDGSSICSKTDQSSPS